MKNRRHASADFHTLMEMFNLRRLEFEWRRIRQIPLPTLAVKATVKTIGLGLGLLLLPVTAILHLAGYRHVTIFTDRIGHLALEPDCLLKEQILGRIPPKKWIMLAPSGRVANEHLLSYWQPHFSIVRNGLACFLVVSMSRWGLMRTNISHYLRAIGKAQAAYRIYAEWDSRPPSLHLTSEDCAWGEKMLGQLGVPSGAWYVCAHVRESGFSPVDEELHWHRNSDIENTIPAMDEIIKQGGWVIRIGDPTMKPLPPMRHVIDYAHHPMKCPRLDIILCARARFILGNSSGIALVGTIFGVPCALANLIPVSTLWLTNRDISIPKLHWSRKQSRHLRFDELIDSSVANFQYASLYEREGIVPVENTAEDILLLVKEMLDRLAGRFTEMPGDAELLDYARTFSKPGHYAFGSQARMAISFLRHHTDLLPPTHVNKHSAITN
jgi:putative glycosyltransferase (TIGR04372 family)